MLSELVRGKLEPQVVEAIEEHLCQCEACVTELTSQPESHDLWQKWGRLLESQTTPVLASTELSCTNSDATPFKSATAQNLDVRPPTISGYEIVCEIGRGGMGAVYLAHDNRLDRHVAIKLLLAGALAGPDRRVRFLNEAVVIARLDHPNIVGIYDVGEVSGAPYLCLEYVAGKTLAEFADQAAMPQQSVCETMIKIADAVQYAHELGILHRDLKPSNILVASGQGIESHHVTPKITDFGLAKLVGDEDYTQTGELIGTPTYMAPELLQGHGSHRHSVTVDIYALGAILYELLTGRPPYGSRSHWETVAKIRESEPIPPRILDTSISRDLETICLKCIHRNPAKRYTTVAEFSSDLRRFRDGRSIAARPASVVERSWKIARRRPWAVVVSGTVAICVALLVTTWIQFTRSLDEARHDAVIHAQQATSHLRQTQDAVRHYLEQVRADQRLGAQGLEPLRESLIEEALEVYAKFVDTDAPEDLLAEYAQAHFELGTILQHKHPQRAKFQFRSALQLLDRPLSAETQEPSCYSCAVSALIALSRIHQNEGAFQAASESLSRADKLITLSLDKQKNLEVSLWKWARLKNAQGNVLRELNRYGEAKLKFEQAIELADQLPSISDFYLERSVSRGNLGRLLWIEDDYDAAETTLREGLEIALYVTQTARPVLTRYRDGLLDRYQDLIDLLSHQDESTSEVMQLYDQSAWQLHRLTRDFPEQSELHRKRLQDLRRRAEAFLQRQNPHATIDEFESLSVTPPLRAKIVAQSRVLLNEGYRDISALFDNVTAAQSFRRCIEILQKATLLDFDEEEAREFTCIAHERLALSLWRQGKDNESLSHIRSAMQLADVSFINLDHLHLLHARIESRRGNHLEATQSLRAIRTLPPEAEALRAQAWLLCAVAAAEETEDSDRKHREFAQNCMQACRTLEASWSAHAVSKLQYGLLPQAKYHATWVALKDRLITSGLASKGECNKHYRQSFQLIRQLCNSSSKERIGVRDAIRVDVQFDSLRGRDLTQLLAH